MTPVRMILMSVAALVSASAFATETLEQHAAAKGVKIGHFYHWNIHQREATDPAMSHKRELVAKFEPGHHSHLQARKMLKELAPSRTGLVARTSIRTVSIAKPVAALKGAQQ